MRESTPHSEDDWETILDAVYKINQCPSIAEFREDVLECVRVLVGGQTYMFFDVVPIDGIPHSINPTWLGVPPHLLNLFSDGDYDNDPLLLGLYLKSNSHVSRDSDRISPEVKENWPMYRDIYKPEGVEYAMRELFSDGTKIVNEVVIFKTPEEGDFTDTELWRLEKFTPHAAQCLKRLSAAKPSVARPQAMHDMDSLMSLGLTERECEVTRLSAQGLSQQEIANELSISPATVKKHIYNIYQKLGVKNRYQLISAISKNS